MRGIFSYFGRNMLEETYESAIGQHLLDNPDCEKLYNDDMFQMIGRARSSFHLDLAVLESIYILTKKPPLCRRNHSFSLLDTSVNFCIGTQY